MLFLLAEDKSQSVLLLAGFACVWCGVLAHRLLRRSVSETAFFRDWAVGWAAMAISTVLAFCWNQNHPPALVAGAVYVAAFPLLMIWIRPRLSFWFPAPERGDGKREENLMPGRNWQTLLWVFLYAFVWIGLRGGY